MKHDGDGLGGERATRIDEKRSAIWHDRIEESRAADGPSAIDVRNSLRGAPKDDMVPVSVTVTAISDRSGDR
jgi:hypothetical protein